MADRWERNKVENAVASSASYREALAKLGLSVSGSNYASIKHHIAVYGLSTAHMTHRAHNRGKSYTTNRGRAGLLASLTHGTRLNTHRLKQRLWRYGLLEQRCYECGITEWRGEPAPLQLDHINGERLDNRLENLRILCPNCHAQTDTWAGRNQKVQRPKTTRVIRKPKRQRKVAERKTCKDCGIPVSSLATRCKSCAGKQKPTVIEWPTNENLLIRLQTTSYSQLARELGVSDNAIRKRLAN